MTHLRIITIAIFVGAVSLSPVQAQFTVYDPANYAQAVIQVQQLIRQYEFLLAQARRVPVDIATRYHGYSLEWTLHELARLQYAQPLITALNEGDVPGSGYRAVTDSLDLPAGEWAQVPADMRRRLTNTYATIELADSANRLAIDQTGMARSEGPLMLQAIRNVEHDIINPADNFHSQTALLEKINAAAAIELRVGEQTNQFLLSSLEQELVDSKRKRDAEARLMNATIYQWRYGQAYGANLFSNTASNLDTWQPY